MGIWRGTDGSLQQFSPAQEAHARAQGFTPVSTAEAGQESGAIDDGSGGVLGGINAATTGALSGATLGLSDVALRGLLSESEMGQVSADRAAHPWISGGANLVGALAPAFLTGGASLPSSLAGRAGVGVAGELGGGLLARAAGGAAEGALYGAGQGVSDLALSRDPLTWERASSTIGSNMLFGGALGGVTGAGSALVERGLQKAGSALEEHAAARAAKSTVAPELADLDAAGLRGARDAEVEQLAGTQTAQRTADRSAVVDDMIAYRSAVKEANPWLVINEGEASAQLTQANRTLRKALDDVKGLRESPGALAKPLRKEEQALESAIANRETIASRLDAVDAKVADDVTEHLATPASGSADEITLTGKAAKRYSSFADVKLKEGAVTVARDDAQGFLDAIKNGEVKGATRQSLDKLDGLLQQNRALQERIKGAIAPALPKSELASERLTAIRGAQDALRAPAPAKSMAEQALSGTLFGAVTGAVHAIPVLGQIPGAAHMVGAKVAELATNLIFGRMGKAIAGVEGGTAAAVKAFSGSVEHMSKYAPVIATKVLSGLRYAANAKEPEAGATQALPEVYKARTDEIKQQTQYDANGIPRIRPPVRQAIADRLKPVRMVDPILGDRLETLAVRRLEYLSSLIPRRPDYGGIGMGGPDKWHPSDMEMRSWARSAAAVEDPSGIEQRIIHGAITPEDAAAYWAVYPERARHLLQSYLTEIPKMTKPLPYARQLALGIFVGKPLTPAMHPRVLATLQAQFPAEPGSAGGTQAPKAAPQMGSIKKSPDAPTPAQSRSQGAQR